MKVIKLDEIKLNYKYKNLKELCEITGIEYKDSTNSRKKIIKELECYFLLEKDGRGYIVTEIYSTPKEKIDNRGKSEGSRNNSTYGKYIDKLILNYLRDCKNNVIYTTNNNIAKHIKMLGVNYQTINTNRYRFRKYLNKNGGQMSITSINNVLNDIYNTIKSVIPSSLRRLEKEGYITFKQDYIVVEKYDCRLVTKEEKEVIKNGEKQIMKDMNLTNTQKNFNYNKRKEFYREVEKLVLQEIDIDNYFVGYRITKIKEIDIDINAKEQQQKLKELLVKKVKKNMLKNQIQIEKEYSDFWGSINLSLPVWIKDTLNCNYISNTDCVIDYVLEKKQDIKQEILNTKLKSDMDKENIELAKEWLEN